MYVKFFKRFFDFIFSLIAVVVLSPVLLALIIVGAVAMRGNPFFRKDKDGNLLPDDVRLNKYGKIMRITSLDELPELFNILKGDMSIVGPRPLLVSYLPWYTEEEHHRHDVRPGLTGLAQVNGRNAIKLWESVFAYDLKYVSNITWIGDLKIILSTISKVFKRSDVVVPTGEGGSGRLDVERRNRQNNVTTR